MPKKIVKFLWSLRQQFTRYFITGTSAVILDMSSLILLKETLHFPAFFAVVVNQIFINIYVFLINKYWSFKQTSMTRRQVLRFGIVVAYNYCFSITTMYIFNHLLGYNYIAVRLASIILAVSWNFFLYKYFVYASGKSKSLNDKSPTSSG
jgi:putative flippase GtrA